MPQVLRIIGGAGTGKTTFLMDRMQAALEAGQYSPCDVGFVSFTVAARQVAAERAGEKFGVDPKELTKRGWFRTLHSICYQQLACKEGDLLADTKADREWLREQLQEDIRGIDSDDGAKTAGEFEGATRAERALNLWQAARNRMCPLAEVWERASFTDERTPELPFCLKIVDAYERAKRLEGRRDFTDILSQFAGVRCSPQGHGDAYPQGVVPEVPVWFLDEQQDTSALLDRVCRRLVEPARWVYLCLDPFQAIYSFAGAEARHAMAWEAKQVVMPRSWRCGPEVQRLGEKILSRCQDYWDREILPAQHVTTVEEQSYESGGWMDQLDPRESWLLLARTNHVAQRLVKRVESRALPWMTTQGTGKWAAPVRNQVVTAVDWVAQGKVIAAQEWQNFLKYVPAEGNLEKGTKSRWEKYDGDPGELTDLQGLRAWGATEQLCQRLKAGRWHELIPGSAEFLNAMKRFGYAAANKPGIRIGTIHSVNGEEADNVVIFTSASHQITKTREHPGGADEERRVEYVGVTRARKRLIVARERQAKHEILSRRED